MDSSSSPGKETHRRESASIQAGGLLPKEELWLLQLLHVVASLAHICSHVRHHIPGDAKEAAHKNVLLAFRGRKQTREDDQNQERSLSQELQQPLVGGTETDEVTDDDGQDESEAASINAVDSRLGDRLLRILAFSQVCYKYPA